MLFVTAAILLIGAINLYFFRHDKKVDFTYKVYRDLFSTINTNPQVKEWLLDVKDSKPIPKDEWYKLGDLFEKIESVETLARQNSLDETVFYDLIAYWVDMAASPSKSPTAKEFIEYERERHKDKIPFADNLYEGFDSLRKRIHDIEVRKGYII